MSAYSFSANAVRQLYVVPNGATVKTVTAPATGLDGTEPDGSIAICSDSKGTRWFEYKSPNFGIVRTDLVKDAQVTNAKGVLGANTRVSYPGKRIILDPTVNGGDPIQGETYMFRMRFYGLGVGGNDVQLVRHSGAFVSRLGTAAETPTLFSTLASFLNKSLAKEPENWVTVAADATGITILPLLRGFSLGKKIGKPLRFELNFPTVKFNTIDTIWGNASDVAGITLNNGRDIAQMEYFYLGERGDQERLYSFPENFDTKYLADKDLEYNVLELEHFYKGAAEDIQRSTKQLSIAVDSANTAVWTALAAIPAQLGF